MIFGSKRDEIIGGWGKLHEELNDMYCSPDITWVIKSRRLRWAGHAACRGMRGACRDLLGEPEGKRPLGRQA